MEDDVKTAYERALERAEKIEVSPQKLQELEFRPQGERLAAAFLKDGKFDLAKALAEFSGEARKHVFAGAQSALLSNIILPRNPRNRSEGKRAMEGLVALKRDKSKLTQVLSKVESLLAYYEQTKQQSYDNLKKEFEGALRRAMQKQQLGLGQQDTRVDAEMQAEFQMRWREVSTRLDMDFEAQLNGLKKEVERVA